MSKGLIMLWSGAIADIPLGWQLCDGTNGTPDLRNKFVVQSGDTYNPDDEGGASPHNHTFTGDGHIHNIWVDNTIAALANFNWQTAPASAIGITDNEANLPLYYALAFVMKV